MIGYVCVNCLLSSGLLAVPAAVAIDPSPLGGPCDGFWEKVLSYLEGNKIVLSIVWRIGRLRSQHDCGPILDVHNSWWSHHSRLTLHFQYVNELTYQQVSLCWNSVQRNQLCGWASLPRSFSACSDVPVLPILCPSNHSQKQSHIHKPSLSSRTICITAMASAA
jgi:hypothetical protein